MAHKDCDACDAGAECDDAECALCHGGIHRGSCPFGVEDALGDDKKEMLAKFREASSVFWPHRLLYTHQNEQYRVMKNELGDDEAMIVWDFSPYDFLSREMTMAETRAPSIKVLHVAVIRKVASAADATTTTG